MQEGRVGDKGTTAPVACTQMEDGWFKKREIWNFLSFSIIDLACSEICFFHLIIENTYLSMSAYTNSRLRLKPNSFNYSLVGQHTVDPNYFVITSISTLNILACNQKNEPLLKYLKYIHLLRHFHLESVLRAGTVCYSS